MSTSSVVGLHRQTPSASNPYSIELFRDLDALLPEWRELEATGISTLYHSIGWVERWCRAAARALDEEPLFVAGRDSDGRLAFIWPFAETRRLGVKTLVWLGDSFGGCFFGVYRADAGSALTRPVLSSLLEAIAAERGLAAAYLSCMPLVWHGFENPFARLPREPFTACYTLPLSNDFDGLYKSCFSSKSRQTHRRRSRQIAEFGSVQLESCGTHTERLELLEIFLRQKAIQLEAKRESNVFVVPAIAAFFRTLAEATSPLEFLSLRVDADPAAIFLGARHKDRFYFIQASHDQDAYGRLSPGFLLLRELIARECQSGTSVFDMGPGEGPHKAAWQPQVLTRFATCISFTASGSAATALAIVKLRAREALHRNGTLYRLYQEYAAKTGLSR